MLNYNQFHNLCQAVLIEMNANSPEAVRAIEMIVAHESSCGTYLRQLDGGPARGIIQMEQRTHDSLWEHADTIKYNALLLGIQQDFKSLEWDLRYNIFMARSFLLVDKTPIPGIPETLSKYLKRVYNTEAGLADPFDYLHAWLFWQKQTDNNG